jgi:hypothetical protein
MQTLIMQTDHAFNAVKQHILIQLILPVIHVQATVWHVIVQLIVQLAMLTLIMEMVYVFSV